MSMCINSKATVVEMILAGNANLCCLAWGHISQNASFYDEQCQDHVQGLTSQLRHDQAFYAIHQKVQHKQPYDHSLLCTVLTVFTAWILLLSSLILAACTPSLSKTYSPNWSLPRSSVLLRERLRIVHLFSVNWTVHFNCWQSLLTDKRINLK